MQQIVNKFLTYMRQFIALFGREWFQPLTGGNELPESCLVYGGLKLELLLVQQYKIED